MGVEEGLEGVGSVPERLGVPLDGHHEAPARHLEPFNHAVLGAAGRDDEVPSHPVDALVVDAVHGNRVLPEDLAEAGGSRHLDPVRAPPAWPWSIVLYRSPYDGRDVLDQCSPGGNV